MTEREQSVITINITEECGEKNSTARGQSFWTGEELVFLDGDPVYTFGLRTIVAYILLMHIDHHSITVIRRLLAMYLVWIVICFLLFVRIVFYPLTILPDCAECIQLIEIFVEQDHSYFLEWKLVAVLFYPVFFTILQLVFLCPIITRKCSLSQVLFWDENKTSLGRFMLKTVDSISLHYRNHQSYEMRLYTNLTQRLGYLIKKKFYVYMFDYFLLETPSCLKLQGGLPFFYRARPRKEKSTPSQCVRNQLKQTMCALLRAIWYLIKLPLVILAIPFITLPLFCLLTGLVNNPRKLLGTCCSRSENICCRSGTPYCKLPWFFVGYFVTICKFWCFLYFVLYTCIFILIDIVRNIRSSLPQLIFFSSIMIYIRNAFVQFEDDFRTLKGQTFKAILQLEKESLEDEDKSDRENQDTSFPIIRFQNGDVAIPKCVFYQVSEDHMPYGQTVCKMLARLFVHLLIISFLFVIIIDFQVLDQFSELGESFITIITVSLPGLFGQIKSEGHKSLQGDQQFNRIKTTLNRLMEDKCFQKEQCNKKI